MTRERSLTAGGAALAIASVAVLDTPRQIVFIGLIDGLSIGLLALGVVLIYRTSRVINFAVGSIGTLSASILALTVLNYGWNFWAGLAVAIVVGAGFSALMELTVITRLFSTPRVVLLVATIGIAQVAELLQTSLPTLDALLGDRFPLAFGGKWEVQGLRVTSAELVVLFAVPLFAIALTLLLTRTRFGKSVQAAATNADKARLSGINPKIVSTFVWTLAGLLAALSTIMLAGTEGALVGLDALGPTTMTRVLAAALIGSMVSFPGALAGGVGIGIALALVRFNYPGDAGRVDALVFLAVVAAVWLIVRRDSQTQDESFSLAPKTRPVPERLRSRWWIRHLNTVAALAGVGLAISLPLLITLPSRQFLWSRMLLLALLGLSLVVLTGWAGQLSLGQGAFAGIGALGTAALARGQDLGIGIGSASVKVPVPELPFGLALLISAAACGLVALTIGLGALRVKGLLLAVVTLAFALAAQQYLWRTNFFSGGSPASVSMPRASIGSTDLTTQRSYYYFSLVLLVAAAIVVTRLRRSGIARTIIAVRDNPDSAAAYTLSPTRAKLISFGVAGTLAGFAGGALGGLFVTIQFNDLFSVDASFEAVSIAVIGGVGSVVGPILGALWVIGLPALWPDNAVVPLLSSSVGLLLLLMYIPGGLVQIGLKVRDALLIWVDRRLTAQEQPELAKQIPRQTTAASRTHDLNIDGAALSAQGVTVSFGSRVVVNAVDFQAFPNETVGLIGANGAGKTTLLNAIGGFVPSTGRISLLGRDISGLSPARRSRHGLGRTFQSATLFPDLTVTETVQVATESQHRTGLPSTAFFLPQGFSAGARQRALAEDIIGFLGLSHFADHFISDLSTGTRRIVELAALIALDNPVLCFDEPTAGIAQREAEAFGPLIGRIQSELDATVVIIEHDMPLIMAVSDRIYCLEAGNLIAEGSPAEIRHNPQVIASYLGTDQRAIRRSDSHERTTDP